MSKLILTSITSLIDKSATFGAQKIDEFLLGKKLIPNVSLFGLDLGMEESLEHFFFEYEGDKQVQ